ncbi:MAG: beta-ketoacyl synthase N-terminal-like domain-containing protein, partial [Candidatus Eremiobacterota bacterium]
MVDPRAVAVIGMACRFPDADSPERLWQNVLARRTSFRPIRHGRWTHEHFAESPPRDLAHTRSRNAAYLDDVESFAGQFFGIAPRRAEAMDPQQRLTLEVAREALQDAGLEGRPFDRDRTAVLVGAGVSEYSYLSSACFRARQMSLGDLGSPADAATLDKLTARSARPRMYSLPGGLISMCATVVSQAFDLRGPSFTVDAACASALVALVQAVGYLRDLPPREPGAPAPVALAGGSYLNMIPDNLVLFYRIGALARTDCRPFDAGAEGFLMGEGVGLLVLKRLQDAVEDGDRIYAVIRGVGWNNDGAAEGPMTPQLAGQLAALRQGIADSGLDPHSFQLIECHGTATSVGDPVELNALAEVMQGRTDRPCLGSIKANIGHTMTAAGAAGLMRAILAIHHRTLPPQANFERWHPNLELMAERFDIPVEPRPWDDSTRRASVSSFGFGGSNAFVALEQAPEAAIPDARGAHLFLCSAATPELLKGYLAELRQALPHRPLAAAAYTQTATRRPAEYAALFVAHSHDEAEAAFEALLEALQEPPDRLSLVDRGVLLGPRGEGRLGFLLPGQAEVRDLNFPGLAERFPGLDLSLPEGAAYGTRLGTAELALAGWIERLGVVPDLRLGHSLGEIVAACLGGAASPEALVKFLELRSRAFEEHCPRGGMLVVRASREECHGLAQEFGLHWAGANHANQGLLAGLPDELERAEATLRDRGVPFSRLGTEFPFHSPLVAPVDAALRELARDLPWNPPEQRDEMVFQAARPVDFESALKGLERPMDLWVELGPGDGLSQCVQVTFPGAAALSL